MYYKTKKETQKNVAAYRPARILINLAALRHNYAMATRIAPHSNILAIIKANAYGHGAVKIAQALDNVAPAFGVACIEEAIELRETGIQKPILLLEGTFTQEEVAIAAEQEFWLMITKPQQVEAILSAPITKPITAWLKADTGMHRLGLKTKAFRHAYKCLRKSGKIKDPIILTTHLAHADELDQDVTLTQIARFHEMIKGLEGPVSIANSAGLMGWEAAMSNWSRPGYMLYGISPFTKPHITADLLKPVMTLESAVISLCSVATGDSVGYGAIWTARRPSIIATIAIGYGDGYPRQAANGTPVLINHQRASLAGRVSMDMITVDVTGLNNITIGSKAELWGSNLSVNEVAEHAGTIGYELLTRLPPRPYRVYI